MPARSAEVVAETDVAVVGGGPAGVCAAVAAARAGARVTLIERYPYLGGLASGGMVLVLDDMNDGDEVSVRGQRRDEGSAAPTDPAGSPRSGPARSPTAAAAAPDRRTFLGWRTGRLSAHEAVARGLAIDGGVAQLERLERIFPRTPAR